jgi:methanogenic corrinoid protein MtbC1
VCHLPGKIDNPDDAFGEDQKEINLMEANIQAAYHEALIDTDREHALRVIEQAMAQGYSAEDVVFKIIVPSLDNFLNRVTRHDISLAQHFLTAQIAADLVETLLPRFQQKPEILGHVVIGTSAGDFHGLGKRIVMGCLKAKMIEVTDLGLNVSADKFVAAALEKKAQVIGISSMMVHTARGEQGCLRVRQLLKEQQLEEQIKLVVGGAPYCFDGQLYRHVGADGWAPNGLEGAQLIAELMRTIKRQSPAPAVEATGEAQ